MEKHLILSRIETPDGTILTSTHQHDFKMYLDTISAEQYMLDGGNSYQRTSINKVPFKDLSVYSTDPHETVREALTWGSYGKNGDEPLIVRPISKLSTEHIKAIL